MLHLLPLLNYFRKMCTAVVKDMNVYNWSSKFKFSHQNLLQTSVAAAVRSKILPHMQIFNPEIWKNRVVPYLANTTQTESRLFNFRPRNHKLQVQDQNCCIVRKINDLFNNKPDSFKRFDFNTYFFHLQNSRVQTCYG